MSSKIGWAIGGTLALIVGVVFINTDTTSVNRAVDIALIIFGCIGLWIAFGSSILSSNDKNNKVDGG